MLWFRFSASVKDVCKAPRDQLDRCAILLRVCIEAEKVTKVAEHGTFYNKMAETLVDKACRYMRAAADPTKEPDWDSMRRELNLSPILELLPLNVRDQLREAEMKDKEARRQMENVRKPSKKSDWTTINLIFLGDGRGNRVGEDYKVKRKTPPLALAAMVIMSKGAGYFPHFYTVDSNPINDLPVDWPADEPTPCMLYVVMDQGRFDFQLKIALRPPIAGNGVFRSIFILPPEHIYLKDCAGKLHLAPAGKFERPVQCMSFSRIDQKRIAGPIPCTQWSEALDRLLKANKDDWVIKMKDNAEQNRQSSLAATPLATSSFPPNYSFRGPIATKPGTLNTAIHPDPSFTTPIPKASSTPQTFSPTTIYQPLSTHRTASTFTNATSVPSPTSFIPASPFNPHSSVHRTTSPPMLVPSHPTASTSTTPPSPHQSSHTPKTNYTSTSTSQASLPRTPVAFGFSPIYKRDGFITRAKSWAKKKFDGGYA